MSAHLPYVTLTPGASTIMPHFSFKTSVKTLMDAIDSVEVGATARLLDEYDVKWAKAAAVRARAWARRYGMDPDADVTVLVRHIVPNSYRYPASGTNLSLQDGQWTVERGVAEKRAHGRGARAIVRIKVPRGFHKVAPVTKRSLVQRYHGGFAYLRGDLFISP